MVNKNLRRIADRLGRKDLPIEKTETKTIDTPQELECFSYIPDLGFYVADRVSMNGGNWYENKRELEEKNSFLLSPRMFWKYYGFVSENREDILHDSVMNPLSDEWLDAIVQTTQNRIVSSPGIVLDYEMKYTYIGGARYSNAIPEQEEGFFNRSQIRAVTGMPEAIWESGDFEYRGPDGENLVVPCRVFNQDMGLYLTNPPHDVTGLIGVRECKLRE
tara:strand:+ start:981 stop:1634 length:654 start_codon:yes stop_codon:yes gene_type:complete